MKKNNNKGFTLAELLIVVAIIAVLVAVAIPVFNTQLEKSRDAVSVSNMRAAYAEAAAEYLTWDGTSTISPISTDYGVQTMTKASGVVTITVAGVDIKSQQGNDWSGLTSELPFTVYTDAGTVVDSGTATFTYTESNGAWALTDIS